MKRTTQRKLRHAALYVLLALILLGAWWAVDWPAVANSFFRVDVIREVWVDFLLIGAEKGWQLGVMPFLVGDVVKSALGAATLVLWHQLRKSRRGA